MAIITDKFYRNVAIFFVLSTFLIILIYQGVFLWKCPFVYLFGIECPGCGFSRALQNLMHGNFLNAISLNFLIIFVWVMPFCFIIFLTDLILGKTYLKTLSKLVNSFINRHQLKIIAISGIYWISIVIYKNIIN